MTPQTPVPQEVVEVHRHKKHLYCRAADAKQWDLVPRFALEDATFEYRWADGTFVTPAVALGRPDAGTTPYDFPSRKAFVDFFCANFEPLQTIHLVDPGSFEPGPGEDEVSAVWVVIYHAGPKGSNDNHFTGGGHYHETWKKVDGDWFLSSLKFVVLYHKV